MMQRQVQFTVNDVAYNHLDVAERLNKACHGAENAYYVRGLCQVDTTVHFILLPLPEGRSPEEYVLAPVEDITTVGVESVLAERWTAGFDTIGMIDAGQAVVFGLYAAHNTGD